MNESPLVNLNVVSRSGLPDTPFRSALSRLPSAAVRGAWTIRFHFRRFGTGVRMRSRHAPGR